MQTSLFETSDEINAEARSATLVISAKQAKVLSRAQQTFNGLVKKISELQEALKNAEQLLTKSLGFYAEVIHPLEKKGIELRKQLVLLIYPHLEEVKSRKDKRIIKHILLHHLNEIFVSEEDPSEELKELYAELEGISFDDALKGQLNDSMEMIQEMAKQMGVDVKFDNVDATDPDELMKKMLEFQEEVKQQLNQKEDKKTSRKKTAKQLEKEAKKKEVEIARNRSIGSIYKQLAKMLHPDLEQDPELKIIKEVQMQKLTSAYDAGDLHTLLKLELEWISNEGNDLQKLSDEKLGIYNALLNEQIEDLYLEINMLPGNPRYSCLQPYYNEWSKINSTQIKKKLDLRCNDLDQTVQLLQSAKAGREIKAMINAYHQYY